MPDQIDIRPPSDVYDAFGRLNYKPWYALAEFVDNSTQNFFTFHDSLVAAKGGPPQLTVDIDYKGGEQPVLMVADDAHGMNVEEFTRALRLNAKPPDRSGRSEFGMGLKAAACWFGTRWRLSSTRLGETERYEVIMDLAHLNEERPDSVPLSVHRASATEHGTTIEICPLRRPLYGRQIERIRDTLASMYRFDLEAGNVRILWRGEPLEFQRFQVWEEALPDGDVRRFRQELELQVEDPHDQDTSYGLRGWVGILATMSSRNSGFALFRRGRLIVGGPHEGWRPHELCGQVGSPEWKRMVGELHLDEFPVNFSKDGFAWDGALEQATIDALEPQVRDYRLKAKSLRTRDTKLKPSDLGRAAESLQKSIKSHEHELKRDLARKETPARPPEDPVEDPVVREQLIDQSQGPSELSIPTPAGELTARLYWKEEDDSVEWLRVSFAQLREIDVFLNTRHPFVAAHTEDDASIELLSKFALALGLAEKRARQIGGDVISPDDLRTHVDVFLRHSTP